MAISGTGAQNDPWIIDNSDGQAWTDLLETLGRDSSGGYGKYIKFANIHYDSETHQYTYTGSGTENAPYEVSTYDEMLDATTATNIEHVKLVNMDNKIYRYKKLTGYDANDNPIYQDIWCKYLSGQSTIDLTGVAMPSSVININDNIDFNGWTIMNLESVARTTNLTNFPSTNGGNGSEIKNLICKDWHITSSVSDYMFAWGGGRDLHHITGNFHFASELPNYPITVIPRGGRNCSFKIEVTGYGVASGHYSWTWSDSVLDYDVVATKDQPDALVFSSNYRNCLIKGRINNNSSATPQPRIFANNASVYNCVFDLETNVLYNNSSIGTSIVNEDKLDDNVKNLWGSSDTDIKKVTTADLKNASTLASLGFPIGVDS